MSKCDVIQKTVSFVGDHSGHFGGEFFADKDVGDVGKLLNLNDLIPEELRGQRGLWTITVSYEAR